jgi:hypothetical protein
MSELQESILGKSRIPARFCDQWRLESSLQQAEFHLKAACAAFRLYGTLFCEGCQARDPLDDEIKT